MNDPTSLHSMAAAEGAKVPAVRRPEPRKHLHCVEVERSGDEWRQVETSGDKWREVETSGDWGQQLLHAATNYHTAQCPVSSVKRRAIGRTNKPFVMFVM